MSRDKTAGPEGRGKGVERRAKRKQSKNRLPRMTHSVSENEEDKHAEYASVKFLLKQVYAAHTAKVRELETQIKKLKQELKDKEKAIVECQKCKEMESAYSACKEEYKNAVLEQTRRLKELELRFSMIEKKNETVSEINNAETDSEVEPTMDDRSVPILTFSPSLGLSERDTFEFTSLKKQDSQISQTVATNIEPNGLKNSTIVQQPVETNVKSELLLAQRRSSNENVVEETIIVPDTIGLSSSPTKISNTRNGSSSPKSKRNGKENEVSESQAHCEKSASPKLNISKKRTFTEVVPNDIKFSRKNSPFKKPNELTTTVLVIEEINSSLSTVAKKKRVLKETVDWSKNFKDFDRNAGKSPSVTKKKDNMPVFGLPSDDDFQLSNVSADESRSWKTSVKKNSQKKSVPTKNIKSSSRFKMTLQVPTEHFKKPNYKQIKLSETVFHPDKKTTENSSANRCSTKSIIPIKDEASKHSETTQKTNETSLAGLSELASLVDADATCIPEGLLPTIKTELVDSQTFCPLMVQKNDDKPENENEGSDDENFLDDVEFEAEGAKEDENHVEEVCDSFDRVPATEEPNYKYKEETVRNRNKRKQLQAFECKECEKYYTELGLSEAEKKDRLKQCSRHRAKHVPPPTPEHFWELDFPDTEECRVRGYIAETQKVQLKTRRRRPLV